MVGKTLDEVRAELRKEGKLNADQIERLAPHKVRCAGRAAWRARGLFYGKTRQTSNVVVSYP